MQKKFLLILVILILASCQSVQTDLSTPTSISPTAVDVFPTAEQVVEVSASPTPVLSPDSAELFAVYLDELELPARKSPEEWKKWPVIPEMTRRSYEIYYQGLLAGNNLQAFSKVGDCQNVKDAFLGKYDNLQRYPLGDQYAYLTATVDNFSGYFDTDGQAVRGGFNAATVLSPLRADQVACVPGESPLDCELRITHPGIVFVSFEVWWEGRTVETYEKYMRQVLDTVIAHGAVPILATKADNIEGDHSLNLATARLAAEYDIPLWNFWAAVQALPEHGMDMERKDGFHISPAAWDARSLTALQSLDHVWHQLKTIQEYIDAANAETDVDNIPAAGEMEPPEPLLWDYPENILFDVVCYQATADCTQGIYRFDPQSGDVTALINGSYALKAISPSAQELLVSHGAALYLVDRADGNLHLVTEQLKEGALTVVWLSDDVYAFLVETEAGVNVETASLSNADLTQWDSFKPAASALYADAENGNLYWDEIDCTADSQCQFSGTWATDFERNQTWGLGRSGNLSILFSGDRLAYPVFKPDDTSALVIAFADGKLIREYPLPKGKVSDFAWLPSGNVVALTLYEQSDYSGRILKVRNLSLDLTNWGVREYAETSGFSPKLLWSPTGEHLIWLGTQEIAENDYQIISVCLSGCSENAELIHASAPVVVQQAFWLP